jgi:carboxypeptidase PM20D1
MGIYIDFFLIFIVISPLGIAIFRTLWLRMVKKTHRAQWYPPVLTFDLKLAAAHLQQLVRVPTVSHIHPEEDSVIDFSRFRQTVRDLYPRIHTQLTHRILGDSNLVYIWQGSDSQLEPALLTAHQDVVSAGDPSIWTHDPFSGDISEGFVWGRGSFDAKGQMTAILESIETLLMVGFVPKRSWWIAFGCDEEVRGLRGARLIASTLLAEGQRFAFVLDEGGAVVEGFLPGLHRPVAVVGIAEKGNLDLKLISSRDGGHSSTPKNPTSLGKIAAAVSCIEHHQAPGRITLPVQKLFATLGLEASFPLALVFLNLWLFAPVFKLVLRHNTTTNAMLRDTHASTMAKGSDASNIISQKSSAVVNFRLLPGSTEKDILSWTRKRIKDDSIQLEPQAFSAPSRVTDPDHPPFHMIERAITAVFPTAITAPYLMLGGTDAHWYEQVSDQVYRFTPALMDQDELSRMHNADERFSLENLRRAIEFYHHLIQNA